MVLQLSSGTRGRVTSLGLLLLQCMTFGKDLTMLVTITPIVEKHRNKFKHVLFLPLRT